MVYFFPIIPAVDGGEGSLFLLLLQVNLFFNGIPCLLTALALWRTARWFGVRRPWLALIPVADLWVLGTLGDRYHSRARGKEKHMGRNLPLLGAAALGSILIVAGVWQLTHNLDMATGLALALDMGVLYLAIGIWGVFLVQRFLALWDLYQGYAPLRKSRYIVLSVLFPFLIPLFIYRCRW